MRIVLDTNVLISALVFGGNPRRILEKVIRGELELHLSESILVELQGVLQRSKFSFSAEAIRVILSELRAISEVVEPSVHIHQIEADPADNRVLECAEESHADFIISGDNHLLGIKEYNKIDVVSPSQFLRMLPLLRSQ